ncbi:hypothetical protein [Bradyrhizobium sp. RDI18]|uniref:hypothetical protein n=1 Tax=Bradyrhizobium sp. RDI18 TaxID=3367400 RepID=UPI0037140A21
MMKRILGFCGGCCAVAGVLTGPDSVISIDALNKAAQDRLRQPGTLPCGVAAEGGLSLNMESNMFVALPFMMHQWFLA